MKLIKHEFIDGKKCKRCTSCKQFKPFNQFYKQRDRASGLRSQCKECCNRKLRQYYSDNRDKYIASMVRGLRNRAKKAQVHIDELCVNAVRQWLLDIYTNGGVCPYCGKPFVLENGTHKRNPYIPSIDRWDNTKGYEMGNVIICCWGCNNAKGHCTLKIMRSILNAKKSMHIEAGE